MRAPFSMLSLPLQTRGERGEEMADPGSRDDRDALAAMLCRSRAAQSSKTPPHIRQSGAA